MKASRDTRPPASVARSQRARLFQSPLALVESLRCDGVRPRTGPEDFSPEFQVCLPYHGLFVWQVGGEDVVADPNQVLFVTGGETFRVSEPLPAGYAELIVTPAPELLGEIVGARECRIRAHPLFRRRSRRADFRLQHAGAQLLHNPRSCCQDGLAADETVMTFLRAALETDLPALVPGPATRRLMHRTKEFVAAHASGPLRLTDIARAVGASPAYLTDVFRRSEGVPLYKYVLQLRLARALVELPHANDLTSLALDLGFSSHSHFAAAFRSAFGTTPSAFRESTRRPEERRIA